MQFNPIMLAATIVGGLIVAAILGWIRKPRLIVLVPRSFSYSQITDRGHLVEISIFNRGFKTEEAIDVTLNHTLRYELIGSNNQDAQVANNRITVPRIGPSDDATVLLLVEPGIFKPDDIVQCLSKETKGRTVAKVEDVPPNGAQRIAIVGIFVVVPALLYGMTFALDFAFKAFNDHPSKVAIEDKKAPIVVDDWKVPWFSEGTSSLLKPFKEGKISAAVGSITRKGDIATVPLTLTNKTDEVLTAMFSANTAGSSKKFKSYELSSDKFVVIPGKSDMRSVRVVVADPSAPVAERTAFIDVHVENMTGQTLSFKGAVEVK